MHMLAAIVPALLHRNGTKVLPAGRVFTKSKLLFLPRTTGFPNLLRLLPQAFGLQLFQREGFLLSCDHLDAWYSRRLDCNGGSGSGYGSNGMWLAGYRRQVNMGNGWSLGLRVRRRLARHDGIDDDATCAHRLNGGEGGSFFSQYIIGSLPLDQNAALVGF